MNVIMDKANTEQEQLSSQLIPWKDTPSVKKIDTTS